MERRLMLEPKWQKSSSERDDPSLVQPYVDSGGRHVAGRTSNEDRVHTLLLCALRARGHRVGGSPNPLGFLYQEHNIMKQIHLFVVVSQMTVMVPRNNAIPYKKQLIFTTSEDNQRRGRRCER